MRDIYKVEVLQGNKVSTDALEQMQTSIEGVQVLIDSLISSIITDGTPVNLDSVRRIISDQLDQASEDLSLIIKASEGKSLVITE